MNFTLVKVTFYDRKIIHDVITSAYQYPFTAKFVGVGVRKKKSIFT